MKNFLSIDLGATSGRAVVVTYDGKRAAMHELARFRNPQIPLCGHVFWDLPHLYNEILNALRLVASSGISLTSIGIDTWGCDVAFFSEDGLPLGLPYCYRDPHTDGAMERYFQEHIPGRDLYERTGIQFLPFNTLFQLYALREERCAALEAAHKVLFIPDALIYLLTGEAVMERTVASTSQMCDPRSGDLDADILRTLHLDRDRFGRLVNPGEQVGVLSQQVRQATGMGPVPVVAVGSHDTASAVAAVPAADADFAYLSCGTWSLLGVESPMPVVSDDSFRLNFTNEGGLDGTTRFLKNITGLWLLEGCRKEWTQGQVPADVNALNALCTTSQNDSLINPDDARLAHPQSMTAAIDACLAETGQQPAQGAADYVRIIFRSLATRYAQVVDELRAIQPVRISRLHAIGGGSQNPWLMQFAADALQMPVVCGPAEGTVMGNALVQMRTAGLVGTLGEMRAVVRQSIELHTYEPTKSPI